MFVSSRFTPRAKRRRSAFPDHQPFVLTATMLNRTHSPDLVSLAASTRTALASRARQRFVVQSQRRNRRSEHALRLIERTTPLAAVAAALTTLACCLPLS